MTVLASPFTSAALAQWLAVLIVFAGVLRISRGGGGSAVTELSKANEVLTRRNHELGAEVRDLRIRVADLESRTDFDAVITRWAADSAAERHLAEERAERRAREHETQAQRRSDHIVHVLDLIAQRLGPEPVEL